ncbi:heme exporter protein CcmD [Stenotrophomonas sp. PD6]|uniref:heme exporter protein CcmD n=1 Tax=Stenotrophomonas sp. PD6 TaxID=3368612 RepID=UPI003B9EFCF0
MTHLPFIIAAFAVFVLVLAADALGTRLRLRAARRQALQRQQRQRARDTQAPATPLATELSR